MKLLWRKPKKKVEVEAPLKWICGCIWVKIIQNMPRDNEKEKSVVILTAVSGSVNAERWMWMIEWMFLHQPQPQPQLLLFFFFSFESITCSNVRVFFMKCFDICVVLNLVQDDDVKSWFFVLEIKVLTKELYITNTNSFIWNCFYLFKEFLPSLKRISVIDWIFFYLILRILRYYSNYKQ